MKKFKKIIRAVLVLAVLAGLIYLISKSDYGCAFKTCGGFLCSGKLGQYL
mgnify:CR=1 FL=1